MQITRGRGLCHFVRGGLRLIEIRRLFREQGFQYLCNSCYYRQNNIRPLHSTSLSSLL